MTHNTKGFNMATILFEEAQRKLAEDVERKRAAAYEAHMYEPLSHRRFF